MKPRPTDGVVDVHCILIMLGNSDSAMYRMNCQKLTDYISIIYVVVFVQSFALKSLDR